MEIVKYEDFVWPYERRWMNEMSRNGEES